MQMINETSRGYLSSTARDTLTSLALPLADDVAETAMRLFATDLQVVLIKLLYLCTLLFAHSNILGERCVMM